MLTGLSFKTKLLLLCLFMSGISIAVGAIGYFGLHEVSTEYQHITDESIPKMNLANKMFLDYRRVRITLRTLGLPHLSAQDAESAIRETYAAIDKYDEARKEYLALGFVPNQKEHYEKLDRAWEDFKETGGRAIALYKTGKPEDFDKMVREIFFVECPQKAKVFTEAGEELIKFHEAMVDRNEDKARAASATANVLSLLAIAAGVALGLGGGVFFSTSLARKIDQIIAKLSENAVQVSSASTQIATSAESMSQAATEQAASLEETASSLEEITSMITKASENAHSTAVSSNESQEKVNRGRAAVDQMLSSMTEINDSNEEIMRQIEDSNRQLTEIVQVIQEIGSKTKVINEIVFQTKLLSFNASVEAARAGEHGKGFAVVAEEVGNLAQMSGNAAKEISDMLDGSLRKVEAIVQDTKGRVEVLVERGKEKIISGTTVAHQCSDVLNEILENVSKVARLSHEISQASKEQSQGVSEINKAMGQLDSVTQQNSSSSQQAASAAESLSSQAGSLKLLVDELSVAIRGSRDRQDPGIHS